MRPFPIQSAGKTAQADSGWQAGAAEAHVHVVDDDASMRQALATALTRHGYGVSVFGSMEAYTVDHRQGEADVLVLDMRLPGQSGLELSHWLAQQGPQKPIIFISGDSAPQEIIDAIKAGAHDFLLKPFGLQAFLAAVDRAFEAAQAQRSQAARLSRLRRGWARLTPREQEVCVLMLGGMANREIARAHGSVSGTVKVHRARVLEKMEVASLSALFELADKHDLRAWLAAPPC